MQQKEDQRRSVIMEKIHPSLGSDLQNVYSEKKDILLAVHTDEKIYIFSLYIQLVLGFQGFNPEFHIH